MRPPALRANLSARAASHRPVLIPFVMASKWPHLEDVERLSDRVIRILGMNPGSVSACNIFGDRY
jgi:hypothetical protein